MKKIIIVISIFLFFFFISCCIIQQEDTEKQNLKSNLISYIDNSKDNIKEIIRIHRQKGSNQELEQLEEYINNPEPYINELLDSEKGIEAGNLLCDIYANNKDIDSMNKSLIQYSLEASQEYQKIIEGYKKINNQNNLFSKSYDGYWWDGFLYDSSFAAVAASMATCIALKVKCGFANSIFKLKPQILYWYIYYPTIAAGLASFIGQVNLVIKFKSNWNGFYDHFRTVTKIEAAGASSLTILGMPELPIGMSSYWLLKIGLTWPNIK